MKRYLAEGNHNRNTGFQRKRLGKYRSEKTRRRQSSAAAQGQPHYSCSERAYNSIYREVRKSVKTDKRDFVKGLAKESERVVLSRNMKQLYDTTKKLAGQLKKSERPIRDKNGTVRTEVDKQLNRWAEHFGELLNRPGPHNQTDIQPALAIGVCVNSPTSSMQSCKAARCQTNGERAPSHLSIKTRETTRTAATTEESSC